MSEDFEGTFPKAGWDAWDDDGYEWGEYYWDKDDYKPNSGNYSAWCAKGGADGLDPMWNNYPNDCDSWMSYGPFSLKDAQDAFLSFYWWDSSEVEYDEFCPMVSIDDYRYYGTCYSGDWGGFHYGSIDLTSVDSLGDLCGQDSVWIAFIFNSDEMVNDYKGAFVDDVFLAKYVTDVPDLVIQRMTPSNYFPTRGETITVDMVIKNRGTADASNFYVGLYYNPLYPPPDIYTYKDKEMHVNTLHATDTLLVRFENVTRGTPGTWNMYGLVDCYGSINESNETNNVIGPTTVHWLDPNQFPDLVIEDVQVSGYCPYVNEPLYVDVTVANRGGMSADMFFTNFYYNLSSRPQDGYDCSDCDDCWWSNNGLDPGARETFTFTVNNNPPFGTTWTMWLWVDPGNNIVETNENNNLDSIEIEWHDLPTFRASSITRDQIIDKGLEFTNVRWVCPVINDTARHCSFEADWTSDYVVGTEYQGEAYEWGGFDDTNNFRCNLNNRLRAGSHQDNDCLPGRAGNPFWATGIDCSGLVTRAFGIPDKKSATMLIDYCDSLKGGYEYVLRGDILIKREKHTYIFDSWSKNDSMRVIEAADFRDEDFPDHSSEARRWNREKSFYESYSAFKKKDVPPPNLPMMSGDANSDANRNVADIYFLVDYLFKQGARPHPLWRGNANGGCTVDVADIVYLVNWLFKSGPPPFDCSPCPGWTCSPYP